jgi:hypothetical protein
VILKQVYLLRHIKWKLIFRSISVRSSENISMYNLDVCMELIAQSENIWNPTTCLWNDDHHRQNCCGICLIFIIFRHLTVIRRKQDKFTFTLNLVQWQLTADVDEFLVQIDSTLTHCGRQWRVAHAAVYRALPHPYLGLLPTAAKPRGRSRV